jgi:hypothetical protein
MDLAPIGNKDIHCVAIHIRENDVLHATGEHTHTAPGIYGPFPRTNDVTRKPRKRLWRLRFQIPQLWRKQCCEPETSEKPLRPAGLVKPQRATYKSQQSRPGEKTAKEKESNRSAAGSVQDAGGLNLRSGDFKEMRVSDTSGAGGFASKATKAKIHLLTEGSGGFHIPVGNGAHE